jgi:hypothetical protein
MTDLKLIESNIVSTLQAVASLNKVYDHEPMDIRSIPAATLFFDGFGQNDEASRRKSVSWRWVVRLYVPLRDAEQAQNDIKSLIVDSMAELRKSPTLGGLCLFHTVASGEVFVAMDQNNPQLMAELRLEATTQENY